MDVYIFAAAGLACAGLILLFAANLWRDGLRAKARRSDESRREDWKSPSATIRGIRIAAFILLGCAAFIVVYMIINYFWG